MLFLFLIFRDYMASSLATSAFVLSSTILKQATQNRLEFENALRGLGMSKHLFPFIIAAPQPRQGRSCLAVATTGRPVAPLMREGDLFRDILQLLNFPRQII
jgi:hypothetical protein